MSDVAERTSLGPDDLGDLVELLRDSIENGASVGYLLPVDDADLRAYWLGIAREIADTGKHLLVLDTEAGSPAQTLYERQGYQLLGVLPRHAGSPDGRLKPCAFFYREL